MKGGSRLKSGAALAALVLAFVGAWEGRSLVAYLDTGGVPTICEGVTRGVRLGMTATAEECDALFMAELIRHETDMRACLRTPDALPDPSYVAVLSWFYNVGAAQGCASTLVRKLNAGDLRGACLELARWKYDNGREVRGLVNRRAAEQERCLSGLEQPAKQDPAPVPAGPIQRAKIALANWWRGGP